MLELFKDLKAFAISGIFCLVLLYIPASLGTWEINPSKWDLWLRGPLSVLWIFMTIFVAAKSQSEEQD